MNNIYISLVITSSVLLLWSCATTTAPENPIPTNTGTQSSVNTPDESDVSENPWDPSVAIESEYTLTTNAGKTLVIDNFWDWEDISTPLILTWKAPRNWFFEGVFPISIVTTQWETIKDWYATWDWMQGVDSGEEISWDDMIEFSATIDYEVPAETTQGKLQFRADNPSGMPENDDSVEVMIMFWE